MYEPISLREDTFGELLGMQRTNNLMPARETFTSVLERFRIQICRSGGDCAGKYCPHNARRFQRLLFLGVQLVDLTLDHLTQVVGRLDIDLLSRTVHFPVAVFL